MSIAYVVPAAPHYRNAQGEENVWLGRAAVAVNEAVLDGALVVFSGDANGGHDLDAFASYAYNRGVQRVLKVRNGELKNTRGDARAVANAMLINEQLLDIETLVVVTCWYHIPRFRIALRQELDVNSLQNVRIRSRPVFGRSPPTGLLNELRGCRDYLLHRPHVTRGGHVGKPDMTS